MKKSSQKFTTSYVLYIIRSLQLTVYTHASVSSTSSLNSDAKTLDGTWTERNMVARYIKLALVVRAGYMGKNTYDELFSWCLIVRAVRYLQNESR